MNTSQESKFEIRTNESFNPYSFKNTVEITKENMENSVELLSSNRMSDQKLKDNNQPRKKPIEITPEIMINEEIFDFIKCHLKDREIEFYDFPKIFQNLGINNIPQNLTVDKFTVFLHKTVQNFINNEDFISHTVNTFGNFLNKEGYNIKKNEEICKVEDHNNSVEKTNTFLKKRNKDILNCPHVDRKHYAKNMCNNCYHRQGRKKKAWLCPHTNKSHYAKGRCQNCYSNIYLKNRFSFEESKSKLKDAKEKDV